MKHSCLQTLLSSSEEMEEPWPKKLKIDGCYVNSKKEQSELLERLCYVDKKPSSKPLSFPVISWNRSQIGLELQAKNNRNLTTSLRCGTRFKPHVNVNLQSRSVGNTSFTEKLTLECKYGCTIPNGSFSEFNKSHKSLVRKPESWAISAKERERSIQNGNISKEYELPAINSVFYHVLPGNRIAKIESLSMGRAKFQSNEYGTGCHQVYDILRSNKQYIPKPLSYDENNNIQIQYLRSPACRFMKGGKSDFGSLLYEYKSAMNVNSNILSYKKQTKSSVNYFRRNKVFQHTYMPYSRNSKVINPKLVKCAVFELFLQDMKIYYSATGEKNDTTLFSQIIVFNTQENEKCTKECLLFSRDTIKHCIFSVPGNEEQMTNVIHSNNQILPGNNFPNSTWKESLCNPKLMNSLTANFGLFTCLTSFPIIFEKLSFKHSGIQTILMETHIEKEKRKTFQENSVLRQYNKHGTGRFRSIINFISKSKYVPGYTGTCKRPPMNKIRYDNCEDCQEIPCGIGDKQGHFSCFDTFKKICFSAEEVDEIYFIGNIMLSAEKNEKYSKVYTTTDKRITDSDSYTWNHSCVPSKLFIKQNFLLKRIKGKRSHCPKDISQCPLSEINNVTFPTNSIISRNIFNCFSNVYQYFTSAISHDITNQSTVSVNEWHSRIAMHGKTGKQNSFALEKIKCVVPYQSLCNSRFYNNLKHPKAEEVENEILYVQKDILLNYTHNSKEIFVKQNAENVSKIENVIIEQSCARKRNRPQNVTLPCLKDKSTKPGDFKDKSTILSSTMKQHLDDATEEHFSLNPQLVNKSYEFEMKNHFDLVLKELHMFNEISKENSKENENSLVCGERDEINKENSKENENSLTCLERDIIENDPLVPSQREMLDEDSKTFCENKVNVSFFNTGVTANTAVGQQNKNEQCSFKDAVLKRPGEQEVPHEFFVSSTSDEELLYSPSEEHCSYWCKQPPTWKPAFVSHSLTEERSLSLKTERGKCVPDGIIRVQPLKTCRRPLRVGLSRRAKPRQLHPYLK